VVDFVCVKRKTAKRMGKRKRVLSDKDSSGREVMRW
jgi:hypothetical protein